MRLKWENIWNSNLQNNIWMLGFSDKNHDFFCDKIMRISHKVSKILVEKKWNSCKIIAGCLAKPCKRMHYSCRILTRSCKNRFILTSFFQDFNVSHKILARIALSSQCCFIAQNESDTFLSFLSQICRKNLAVSRFRTKRFVSVQKTTTMILCKRTR